MSTSENDIKSLDKELNKESNKDEFEEIAKQYGYNPNDKKSPKDFILYALKNLPKKTAALENQNKALDAKDRKLNEMDTIIRQLASDMEKQKEVAYKQALADLQAQKRQAVQAGNVALVDQLDEKQQTLKKEQLNMNNKEDLQQQTYNKQLIEDFREEHKEWLHNENDPIAIKMRMEFRKLEKECIDSKTPLEEGLKYINYHLKEKFSDYFEPDNRKNPVSSASQSSNVSSKNKSFSSDDLSPAQRHACEYLVARGLKTEEQYIKMLIENGDLK